MDEQTDVSLQVVALALPDGCAFIVATLFLPHTAISHFSLCVGVGGNADL